MKNSRLLLALALALGAGAVAFAAVAPDGGGAGGSNGRLGPAPDAAAAERGGVIYGPACAFCHGAEGRGAQGPNLHASLFVIGDPSGKPLHDFLQVGRVSTGMPPFPQFTPDQVRDMTAFLQSRARGGRRRTIAPDATLVGDIRAGQAYFNGEGRCATCHSPTGDLRGVGARYAPMLLQGRMINPRTVGRGPGQQGPNARPATVKVTLPRGEVVQGPLIQVNEFFVILTDAAGVRRTLRRTNDDTPKVEITDPLEAHRQQMLKWTDQNMWNVTAYLASLK